MTATSASSPSTNFHLSLGRYPVLSPNGRMSVAILGHGKFTFPWMNPLQVEAIWDDAADVQLLCDPASLAALMSGGELAADSLFLFSGNARVLDRLGPMLKGAGSALALRAGSTT